MREGGFEKCAGAGGISGCIFYNGQHFITSIVTPCGGNHHHYHLFFATITITGISTHNKSSSTLLPYLFLPLSVITTIIITITHTIHRYSEQYLYRYNVLLPSQRTLHTTPTLLSPPVPILALTIVTNNTFMGIIINRSSHSAAITYQCAM